jgi:cell shape-determining protein MreC
MKKTFLARRNTLLSSANFSWGFFVLSFAVLMVLVRFATPNFFMQAIAPAFRASSSLSAGADALLSNFENTAKLAADNEELKKENAALAEENRTLLESSKSIGALQGPGSAGGGIFAGVVARPPTSPYDTLVLSGGSKSGIIVGQEAFGNGGTPIGIVSSVLPDFSRVTLFSAPNILVDGWVGTSSVPITIIGSGGGTMHASLARSATVEVGDTVFVSGPGMIPVGAVAAIDSDPSSPSITLRIQSAVNIYSVTWVALRSTGAAFASSLSWATSTRP